MTYHVKVRILVLELELSRHAESYHDMPCQGQDFGIGKLSRHDLLRSRHELSNHMTVLADLTTMLKCLFL
jgi:hypothetical protein